MQTWCMIIEQNIFIIIYTKDGKQKAFFPIPIYIYIYILAVGHLKPLRDKQKWDAGFWIRNIHVLP